MEDLIQPQTGAPRTVRILRSLIVALSIGMVVATAVIDLSWPARKFKLVGQEAADARAARNARSVRDGSWAKAVEMEIRLRSSVRRAVAPYWSALMLRCGDAPSRDVIVGRGDWLFLRRRTLMSEAGKVRGRATLANLTSALRRQLAPLGTRLVVLPLPRKAVACSDRLPPGVDPDVAFDHSVVTALSLRGVDTVDVVQEWIDMPAEDVYFALDTHWRRRARISIAKQLGIQFPKIERGTTHAWYQEADSMRVAFMLDYVGVYSRHPVQAWFRGNEERPLELLPPSLLRSLDAAPTRADVLLVGSSFSAGFDFQVVLVCTLQAPVRDASEAGQPPFVSMAEALRSRGRDCLPAVLLSEVPIFYFAGMRPGAVSSMRAVSELFGLLAPDTICAVPVQRVCPPVRGEPKVGKPLLRYSRGALPSSGCGAILVELTFDGSEPSTWDVVTSGTVLPFNVPAGHHTRLVPVIERELISGAFTLRPRSAQSLRTLVEARVVTDAALDRGREIAGSTTGAGTWSSTETGSVEPFDCLYLRWEENLDNVTVELSGRDASGEVAEATWTIRKARSRFALINLGPFESGVIEDVVVSGVDANLQVAIVPLASGG